MDQTSAGAARCRRSRWRAPSSTRGTVSTPVPAGGPGPGTQGSGPRGAEAPSTETLCQRTLRCPGPGRCPRWGWGSTPRPHGNGSVKRTPQDPPEKEVRATPSPRRPALGGTGQGGGRLSQGTMWGSHGEDQGPHRRPERTQSPQAEHRGIIHFLDFSYKYALEHLITRAEGSEINLKLSQDGISCTPGRKVT